MKNIKTLLVWLLVTSLTISAHAVIVHNEHTDRDGVFHSREEIAALALEMGAQFPSVGQAVGNKDGKLVRAGSAVAVADTDPDHDYAVSAAHTLTIKAGPRQGERYDAYHLVFGENSKEEVGAGRLYTPDEIIVHPTQDLVLLQFPQGTLDEVPKANISFETLREDQLVCLIGIGDFGHLNDTDTAWDGYRRGVEAHIETFGERWDTNYLVTRFHSDRTSEYILKGGKGYSGDSGGGTFLVKPNESFSLVAINAEMSDSGTRTGVTASLMLGVSEIRSFLEPYLTPEEPQLVDEEDDDKDGWNNLAEYALGTNPRDSASRPELVYRMTEDELVINYLQLEGGEISGSSYIINDVCYVGEASSDLKNWTIAQPCEASYGLPPSPDGCKWGAFRVPANSHCGFLRIRIIRGQHQAQ